MILMTSWYLNSDLDHDFWLNGPDPEEWQQSLEEEAAMSEPPQEDPRFWEEADESLAEEGGGPAGQRATGLS